MLRKGRRRFRAVLVAIDGEQTLSVVGHEELALITAQVCEKLAAVDERASATG